jgi:hypothetical protein
MHVLLDVFGPEIPGQVAAALFNGYRLSNFL